MSHNITYNTIGNTLSDTDFPVLKKTKEKCEKVPIVSAPTPSYNCVTVLRHPESPDSRPEGCFMGLSNFSDEYAIILAYAYSICNTPEIWNKLLDNSLSARVQGCLQGGITWAINKVLTEVLAESEYPEIRSLAKNANDIMFVIEDMRIIAQYGWKNYVSIVSK